MGWIYRDADQHKCPKPNLERGADVRSGDLWECDGPGGCGALYVVREHQFDGTYFEQTTMKQQPMAVQMAARGRAQQP